MPLEGHFPPLWTRLRKFTSTSASRDGEGNTTDGPADRDSRNERMGRFHETLRSFAYFIYMGDVVIVETSIWSPSKSIFNVKVSMGCFLH